MVKNISQAFQESLHLLLCPICGKDLAVKDGQLKCGKNHSFDLARSGYVNLILKPARSAYGKGLFMSRRRLAERGFFEPLESHIVEMLSRRAKAVDLRSLLDAGCGEGGILENIKNELRRDGKDVQAIGIDICKSGIQIASKKCREIAWIAADLAQLPVKSDSFDAVINLLSPANYLEFRRALKRGGLLIKVVPGDRHFRELRETIGLPYQPNPNVRKIFKSNFSIIEENRITRTIALNAEIRADAIAMSPLAWNHDLTNKLVDSLDEITIDISLLAGEK